MREGCPGTSLCFQSGRSPQGSACVDTACCRHEQRAVPCHRKSRELSLAGRGPPATAEKMLQVPGPEEKSFGTHASGTQNAQVPVPTRGVFLKPLFPPNLSVHVIRRSAKTEPAFAHPS